MTWACYSLNRFNKCVVVRWMIEDDVARGERSVLIPARNRTPHGPRQSTTIASHLSLCFENSTPSQSGSGPGRCGGQAHPLNGFAPGPEPTRVTTPPSPRRARFAPPRARFGTDRAARLPRRSAADDDAQSSQDNNARRVMRCHVTQQMLNVKRYMLYEMRVYDVEEDVASNV